MKIRAVIHLSLGDIHKIVSCRAREKFCLVENDSRCGWIKER